MTQGIKGNALAVSETSMKVYAVKLRHNKGISKGREGYHSVWRTKADAEHHAALRNNYTNDFKYFVVEQSTAKLVNWNRKGVAKFPDSGYMDILDRWTMNRA